MGVVRIFMTKMENLLNTIRIFANRPELAVKFSNSKFCSSANGYVFATRGLVNLFHNDTAMGDATRAYLLTTLEKADVMPRVPEAQRREHEVAADRHPAAQLGQGDALVLRRDAVLQRKGLDLPVGVERPAREPPRVQEGGGEGKNITILKYHITIHPRTGRTSWSGLT
jgi:callose synthase